jgi:hypothetical protein
MAEMAEHLLSKWGPEFKFPSTTYIPKNPEKDPLAVTVMAEIDTERLT